MLAKDRMRDNISEPLDRSRAGGVLLKRNVSSHLLEHVSVALNRGIPKGLSMNESADIDSILRDFLYGPRFAGMITLCARETPMSEDETGLPGWACRTRTQKRRRKLSL